MTAAPGSKMPQTEILNQILMRDYYLGRTTGGEPFAVRNDTPMVLIPVKGKGGLRQRLARDMFRQTARAPTNEALATVLTMVEGMASSSTKAYRPALRVASKGDERYLDLGRPDGTAVVISPRGWQLSTRGVLFRRSALTGPLPVPCQPGTGSIEHCRHLFNIAPGGEWTAYIAARIASLLFPLATHPAEIFTSDTSGSVKTATVKITKDWTDPGPFLPVPRDSRSWAATASSTYVAAIDNVSFIADWWSDLLCKGSSGDAWAGRELYTNLDAVSIEFSVVPLLNGIGMVSVRADLADRAIRYHLSRPAFYLGDDEAADAWQRSHPYALGWLLDQAAATARVMGCTPRPRTGRLSNYEWVLVSLDRLWSTGGSGHAWWTQSQRGVAADAVAGDALASAIATRIGEPQEITAGQLLLMLAGALPDEDREEWSARKISSRMPRAADALTKLGWYLKRGEPGHAGSRQWTICPPGTWSRHDDGSAYPIRALPSAMRHRVYKGLTYSDLRREDEK